MTLPSSPATQLHPDVTLPEICENDCLNADNHINYLLCLREYSIQKPGIVEKCKLMATLL